jgi:hypothetical protein
MVEAVEAVVEEPLLQELLELYLITTLLQDQLLHQLYQALVMEQVEVHLLHLPHLMEVKEFQVEEVVELLQHLVTVETD